MQATPAVARTRSVYDEINEAEREALADAKRREQQRLFLNVVNGGNVSMETAQMIMGPNFWGPSTIISLLDCQFDHEAMAEQTVVPFSDKILLACRKTHVLFLGAGVSLIQLRAMVAPDGKSVVGDFFYDDLPMARQMMPVRWYLVRRELLCNSLFRSYHHQEMMLSEKEERLSAVEYAYYFVLHRLKTGKWPLNHTAVISSDRMSVRAAIFVGQCSDEFGVGIGTWDPLRPGANLGLLPAVKPTVVAMSETEDVIVGEVVVD